MVLFKPAVTHACPQFEASNDLSLALNTYGGDNANIIWKRSKFNNSITAAPKRHLSNSDYSTLSLLDLWFSMARHLGKVTNQFRND